MTASRTTDEDLSIADERSQLAPENMGSLRIRPAALPVGLAVQLFSAREAGQMDGEALAGAVLALGEPQAVSPVDLSHLLAGQGCLQEAESLLRQALAAGRAEFGTEGSEVLRLQVALAGIMQAQGRLPEARRLLVASVDTQRRILGDYHLDTLSTLERLAMLLIEQDDARLAEPLLCEAVATRREVQGDAHPDTLRSLSHLAALLTAQGRMDQAEALLRRGLNAQRRLLGEDHLDTLATMGQLAQLLERMGNVADAEALLVRACVLSERGLGEGHHQTLVAACTLSTFLMHQGRHNDARPHLTRTLKLALKADGADAFFIASIEAALGACLRALALYEASERQLTSSYERARTALGLMHPRTQSVLSELIALYDAWGKPRHAAPYRAAHAACS